MLVDHSNYIHVFDVMLMEIGIDWMIAAGIPCSHIRETPYKDSVLHNVQSNEELVSVSS